MDTYRLTLDVHIAPTDHLVGVLSQLDGIASVEEQVTGVIVLLDAKGETPADALAAATTLTLGVIIRETGDSGRVVAAEILTEDEAERRLRGRAKAPTRDEHSRGARVSAQPLGEPEFPELVGLAEIADLLEITQSRARALQARVGFPAPVAVLRSGPVWRLEDLSNFARTSDPPPERSAAQGAPVSPPVDIGKLVGTVSNLIPNPVARNAVKLVRWYTTKPKN